MATHTRTHTFFFNSLRGPELTKKNTFQQIKSEQKNWVKGHLSCKWHITTRPRRRAYCASNTHTLVLVQIPANNHEITARARITLRFKKLHMWPDCCAHCRAHAHTRTHIVCCQQSNRVNGVKCAREGRRHVSVMENALRSARRAVSPTVSTSHCEGGSGPHTNAGIHSGALLGLIVSISGGKVPCLSHIRSGADSEIN